MYRNTTEQCRQVIDGSSRTFAASFLCGETTYSDIKSLKISVQSALSGKINIGDTISKSVEIEIGNADILLGSKIEIFESVKLGAEEYEDIPMGKFTVSKAVTKESITTIEAEGPLTTETSIGYFSELVYPVTTIQMLNELSDMIGITIKTDGLEEIVVSTKPEGYTCREVIGYIAALHGSNAVETREGTIALKWYEDCEEDIFTDKMDSPELENDLFVIEKFECIQDETTITRGNGFTGISIENPLMTEEMADFVWIKISGFSYRPGTFSLKSGTPLVDPWDSFIYNNERVIAAELEYIHDGGLQNTYKSVGESKTTSASKGPIAQKLDRYYADLLLVKEAMVDVLTVNEADIRYLKADSISAITLVVKEAAIAELSADFVTVESMEANYANITLSNVEKSTIGTLFADIGLITDATIVDGHVTGFLDAVEVNANSVTTGTLSVDRLVFRGAEKSIVYELNNITGALQAVQSETLNGEILTNRSITVDKIVAKSITANEIATATITANELAANSITADKIVANAITSAKIASGAITADKIATKTITADKINVDDLFAQSINATGSITGATLFGGKLQTSDKYGFVTHYGYYSRYERYDYENYLLVCDAGVEFNSVKKDGMTHYCHAKFTKDGEIGILIDADGLYMCREENWYSIASDGTAELNTLRINALSGSLGAFVVPVANGGTGLSATIKFYNAPTQLSGVNKSTATLDTIINAMSSVWENSEVRFWVNTATEFPKVNAEVLAGAQSCGFNGTSIYGNVTITRINNEWTVTFEDYSSTRNVYIRRYTKTNSLGWSTWEQILTANETNTTVTKLKNTGGRVASANIAASGNGCLSYIIASSSMATAKPEDDGKILHMEWDNNSGYSSQLYVGHGATPKLQLRGMSGGTWGNWITVYTTANKPTRADLGLGSAATYSTTTSVTSGSGALITSGAVYSELKSLADLMPKNYLSLTGGTMSGDITTSGNIIFTNVGCIRSPNSSSVVYISASGTDVTGLGTQGSYRFAYGQLQPGTNNSMAIGSANYKFTAVYAVNGTIQTSDRNLKDNIKPLSDNHKKFFMKLVPVSFAFIDGTSGRTHIGFISQDVELAMYECGMTDLDFAGFCKDVKTTVQHSYEIAKDNDGKVILNADGNPEMIKIEKEVPLLDENGNEQYIYSLRYEEFIGLIAYVLQDTVNRLDIVNTLQQNMLNRVAILEAKLVNMAT